MTKTRTTEAVQSEMFERLILRYLSWLDSYNRLAGSITDREIIGVTVPTRDELVAQLRSDILGDIEEPELAPQVIRNLALKAEQRIEHDFCGVNEIELDDKVNISVAEDGNWVSAWIWVPNEE